MISGVVCVINCAEARFDVRREQRVVKTGELSDVFLCRRLRGVRVRIIARVVRALAAFDIIRGMHVAVVERGRRGGRTHIAASSARHGVWIRLVAFAFHGRARIQTKV